MRKPMLFAAAMAVSLAPLGCDAGKDAAVALLGPQGPLLSVTYDTVTAEWAQTSYPISRYVIAGDCGMHVFEDDASKQGLCPMQFDSTDVTIVVDDADNTGWFDAAIFDCGGGVADTIFSSHSCWYCRYGCSDPYWACNGEDACVLEEGERGGDCRGYNCPTGYTMLDHDITEVPKCVKEITEPEVVDVTIDGPTEIQEDGFCTWWANASGGSGSYSYSWYYDGSWVGSGDSYTGGVLDGDIDTSFRLTVYAWDGSSTASEEIFVSESPNARICFQ
jgi:hypothetical protein